MASILRFDEIGLWSEIKLDILKKYASAYTTILSAQTKAPLFHVYVDAFAGAGQHISESTQEIVPGSPLNALAVKPEFREYYFIDLAPPKAKHLRELVGARPNVFVYEGDCNGILIREIFPRIRYQDYKRGLCVLDPYGLHLDFGVIQTAGQMKSIDMFLNFPVQDMNRNVFWRNPDNVDEAQIRRMNAFWGDESWRSVVYETSGNLFGIPEKQPNEVIAEAFRKRLKEIAGFETVPAPLPMRNSVGAIGYYLFFASQKSTAARIASDIFERYRK